MPTIVLQLLDAFPKAVSESRPQAASQSSAGAKTHRYIRAKTQVIDSIEFFHMQCVFQQPYIKLNNSKNKSKPELLHKVIHNPGNALFLCLPSAKSKPAVHVIVHNHVLLSLCIAKKELFCYPSFKPLDGPSGPLFFALLWLWP
jgi:hypothetical protein